MKGGYRRQSNHGEEQQFPWRTRNLKDEKKIKNFINIFFDEILTKDNCFILINIKKAMHTIYLRIVFNSHPPDTRGIVHLILDMPEVVTVLNYRYLHCPTLAQ